VLAGGNFEIGAAWKRTSKENTVYHSVKLDDPSLPAPIYANLVEAEGHYALVWSRWSDPHPQGPGAASAPALPARQYGEYHSCKTAQKIVAHTTPLRIMFNSARYVVHHITPRSVPRGRSAPTRAAIISRSSSIIRASRHRSTPTSSMTSGKTSSLIWSRGRKSDGN